jgi:predicted acyltransferase
MIIENDVALSDTRDSSPTEKQYEANQSLFQDRIASIDQFRGILVVISASAWLISPAIHEWPHNVALRFLSQQLSPSIWHGVTLYDLIVPAFLFVVGLSAARSIDRRRHSGETSSVILIHLAIRCFLLFIIGVILGNLSPFSWAWGNIRFLGVVQRIALCRFLVGVLCLVADRTVHLMVVAMILVNYGLMFDTFAVVPPVPSSQRNITLTVDPLSFEYNIAAQVDKAWLPGRKYQGNWDAQGLLTTLPAVAITLLGAVLHGSICWQARGAAALWTNRGVSVACVVLVLFGLAMNQIQPLNSYLLTPAFVVVNVGVFGVLLLALNLRSGSEIDAVGRETVMTFGRNAFLFLLLFSAAKQVIPEFFPWIERTTGASAPYPHSLLAIWGILLLWLFGRAMVRLNFSIHM